MSYRSAGGPSTRTAYGALMAADWVARVFDDRAATYDDSAMHRDLAAAAVDFASVEQRESLLDVATGTGLVLRALSRRGSPADRMADVDQSAGMLAVARDALPGADLRQAAAESLPFDDGAFDAVFCVAALPYLSDANRALAEWVRCLAPGGRIVVSAFATWGTTGNALRSQAAAAEGLRVDDPNEPWGSPSRMEAFASRAHLRVQKIREWSTTVKSSSADALLGSGYPLQARDDLRTASEEQVEAVRRRLSIAITQERDWTTRALLVAMHREGG